MNVIYHTEKCPLRGHILAPPEGLRTPGSSRVNPGVDPRSQGVIPRRFKRKQYFVMPDRQTDNHVGRNSDVDMIE